MVGIDTHHTIVAQGLGLALNSGTVCRPNNDNFHTTFTDLRDLSFSGRTRSDGGRGGFSNRNTEFMSINRRRVLQGMTAGMGIMGASRMSYASTKSYGFTHGIASGDPLSDRVILWTRYLPKAGASQVGGQLNEIIWQVADDASFTRLVASGTAATSAGRDYTVKVDATGLQAGKRYFYRFRVNGEYSPIGSTKTLPVGDVPQFRMAVASCSNYPQGYFHAYDDIAKSDLDVVLHLGDYIYEYARGVYVNPIAEGTLGRAVEPENEILTLDDYRARYAVYRADKDLQAAHAAHPWICVWDDHELMNNTWKTGAQNHNEGEGDFDERIAMARKAYHEWMPIRTAAQTDQAPIYRQFQIGNLADLIMLDTRLHGRDEQLIYQRDIPKAGGTEPFVKEWLMNPNRTILGAEQENWLASQLAAGRDRGATWQIIGQQVLMGKLITPVLAKDAIDSMALPKRYRERLEGMREIAEAGLPMNLDAWDGYPVCRDRIHATFKRFAKNPVVLAGDTHNGWAFNMQDQEGDAIGVEIGTPGITSPGMEAYLPAPPDVLKKALKASSKELYDLDTARRGWTHIEFTPKATTSKWRFVSTILESRYSITESEPIVCKVGEKQFG